MIRVSKIPRSRTWRSWRSGTRSITFRRASLPTSEKKKLHGTSADQSGVNGRSRRKQRDAFLISHGTGSPRIGCRLMVAKVRKHPCPRVKIACCPFAVLMQSATSAATPRQAVRTRSSARQRAPAGSGRPPRPPGWGDWSSACGHVRVERRGSEPSIRCFHLMEGYLPVFPDTQLFRNGLLRTAVRTDLIPTANSGRPT